MNKNNSNIDLGLFILRIATGGLMLFHGISKMIHGHDFIKASLVKNGLPEIMWFGVPIAEVIAPICLILGIFSRISGLLIVLVMLFSIFLVLGLNSFTLTKTGGLTSELNLLFLFNGLVLFLTGPGKYKLIGVSKKMLQ